jgi:hypothetical protein
MEEQVSNVTQAINLNVTEHEVASAPIIRTAAELGVPPAAAALMDRMGIRTIAERVAAVARLSGQARVLITGCRIGDGASTVAGALALDLSLRLSIETLLVSADSGSGTGAAERRPGSNGGRAVRANPTPVARLWTVRCAKISEPVYPGTFPASTQAAGGRDARSTEAADAVEELRQTMACYRAVVMDVGVVRLDARMLAVAAPDDPVLIVVRCGSTRREELTATQAILNLAKCKIGGVILNGYESPATDWLRHILSFRRDRCEPERQFEQDPRFEQERR